MRTKTLLLTAALSAAGIATSMAQVYSVNAVGYVNVTLVKGYNLIANPLNNGGNTLMEILPPTTPLPDDTQVIPWDSAKAGSGGPASDLPVFYPTQGWDPAGPALPPGKAFFVYIPKDAAQTTYTVTFVGEVPQGSLSNPIATGKKYSALASQVPQSGKISADLGLQGVQDDQLLAWDKAKGGFASKVLVFDEGVGWNDGADVFDPVLNVADGFFLYRTATGPNAWTRTFNVNQ